MTKEAVFGNWKLLIRARHPSYSPDVAPTDFRFFLSLSNVMPCALFATDAEFNALWVISISMRYLKFC